jgi:hypothetical protein
VVISERPTSTTSSSEIVNETTIAISHETPRSVSRAWCPFVDRPATTTPVITLITGAAASRRQRRERPGAVIAKSFGSSFATSSSTGRTTTSIAKKRTMKL